VETEDFAEAAELKKAILKAADSDAVAQVMTELKVRCCVACSSVSSLILAFRLRMGCISSDALWGFFSNLDWNVEL
jgi:hypothetical protein